MFLRRHTRTKKDETYEYWTLVESLRTADGPRQRIVATMASNRADVMTVEEVVETMREKHGHERRSWVMDRGMVSEDNLEMLREARTRTFGCAPSAAPKSTSPSCCRNSDFLYPTNQSRSEM